MDIISATFLNLNENMSEFCKTEEVCSSIPAVKFYGKPKLKDGLRLLKLQETKPNHTTPHKLKSILGPSKTWIMFRKQRDAMECVKLKKNGLMPFAIQQISGERVFMVAHPSVFWFHDTQRNPADRCTYEIIPEHSVSKLYFDLEFNRIYNPEHDGVRMTEIFIKITSYYILKKWGLFVNRSHVLDLDSTYASKFSRHLIYQIPNYAFKDNYHVGNFVKEVCNWIRSFIYKSSCSHSSLENDKDILELNRIYSIENSDICELMIFDKKGSKKLFCDEAVYTKNRHFRLFMSTKRGKSSPLVVSKENNFKPSEINVFSNENSNGASRIDNYSASENMFLHSLITYFPANDNINILECNHVNEIRTANVGKTTHSEHSLEGGMKSPYPEVDCFIRELVTPMGRIWRSCYFSSNNLLSYDIVGYRYCNNIGRQHRSNNIKYIVDLANYCYYQKCYDPDCFNYRSVEIPLPPELVFHLEDAQFFCSDGTSSQSTQGCSGMPTGDFTQVLEAIEGIGFTGIFEDGIDWHKELVAPSSLAEAKQEFPDYGVSDSELLNVSGDIAENFI